MIRRDPNAQLVHEKVGRKHATRLEAYSMRKKRSFPETGTVHAGDTFMDQSLGEGRRKGGGEGESAHGMGAGRIVSVKRF